MRTLLRSALATVALAGSITLTAGTAQAAALSPAQLASVTDEHVFATPLPQFTAVRATTPHADQLDWTSDACSYSPDAPFGHAFTPACDRHDFGYRNYGKNTSTPGVHLKLDPTSARKKAIDSRFYSNMKKQCDDKYGNPVTTGACKVAAKTFYTAVDKFGGSAFYG